MKKMTATEFDKLNIENTMKALPVEVTSSGKTLFFAVRDNPKTRSAVNTYTEQQVIQIMTGRSDDPAAVEAAEQKIAQFHDSRRSA